jgi:hypothetical protein
VGWQINRQKMKIDTVQPTPFTSEFGEGSKKKKKGFNGFTDFQSLFPFPLSLFPFPFPFLENLDFLPGFANEQQTFDLWALGDRSRVCKIDPIVSQNFRPSSCSLFVGWTTEESRVGNIVTSTT